jgi:O-antigen ligase
MKLLALVLCLLLILYLLVRDSKRRGSVSAAIWMPTLMLLVLGSRSFSEWIGAGNGQEGNWIDQAFYLSLIVGSWIVGSLRRVNWSKLFAANTAITVFYIYFAVSALWSDDPGGSFKRWFKLFGIIFVVSVILSEKDPREAIRAVYARCAIVLMPLSVVFIKYYPAWGRSYSSGGAPMINGVSQQKNSLGEMVMVFSLFLVWDYLETRPDGTKRLSGRIPWDRLALLLMGIYLLIISESKTSLLCLLIGLALLFGRGWFASRTISRMVFLAATSLPFLLFFTQQFTSIFTPILGALGRDATLTGRTDIWQHITSATVNPLIGAGYFSFWGTKGGIALREVMQGASVHSAHDGYLDIYLDGGWIGVGLLFCLLIACGSRLIRGLRRGERLQDAQFRYQWMRFAFLIVIIVYNLSESTFARLSPTWFTAVLLFIDLPSPKAEVRIRGREFHDSRTKESVDQDGRSVDWEPSRA